MGYAPEDIRRLRPLPGLQSVAAAIQNMLLAVHALGYGSCWMTGPLVAQEAFGEAAWASERRSPLPRFCRSVLPDEDPPARSRKTLEEIVSVK